MESQLDTAEANTQPVAPSAPSAESRRKWKPQGPRFRNISMASWLALAVLGVTIASLLVAAIVSLSYGNSLADGLVTTRLATGRSLQADQVERYFDTLENRTKALAASQLTVDAATRFGTSYQSLNAPGTAGNEAIDAVSSFYRDDFAPTLEESVGLVVPWRELMPLTDAGVYLQDSYVAPLSDPAERSAIDDAGDGSDWTAVHTEFHPEFLSVTDRYGFEDLYVVAPDGGAIVYSTEKGVDFATDLNVGPYSGTTLASLVRAVSNNPEAGVVSAADLAAYVPALAQPVGFFASPIFDGDTLVGILAVEMPVDEINQIMTFNGKWAEEGFGETGETFLMGGDGRMRSISRFWLDDPAAYLEAADAAGSITATEHARMEATDTTIVYQRVATPDTVDAARTTSDELEDATNYLGDDVRFTAEHLDIEGLDWFVISSVETAELNEPLDRFRTAVLIAVALFVVAITFLTVGWAREMFRPIREISERLRRVHDHEPDEPVDIPKRSPAEFKQLAANLDRMIDVSTARQIELETAVNERFDTVRSLLPPSISARLEAGDTDVLDSVPNASVVVLSIGGLGELVHLPLEESRRLLDRAIEELDAVGARHGVERAKLVGDVYYAGCGLNQWYLDHAPRAVAFAREALDALQALVDGEGIDLTMATGIKSGPVTIGLAGSARLVYDLWGDTVDGAQILARSASPGKILIADSTRELIPSEDAVVPWGGSTTDPPVWEIDPLPTTLETSS